MFKFKSLLIAFAVILCSAGLYSQPIMESEQNENIANLIGNYQSSYIYNGFDVEWSETFKRNFTYKENMKPVEFVQQSRMISGWMNSLKYVYAYNINDSLESLLVMEANLNDFYNSRMISLTYDESGNVSERLTQNWYGDYWAKYNRSSYTYNASRNVTESVFQNWSDEQWTNVQKSTFSYLHDTLLTQQLVQNWADSVWTNSFKVILDYDNFGNVIEQRTGIWTDSTWTDNNREIREYDETGKLNEVVYDTWASDNWVNTGKNIYTYNEKELVVEVNNYQWADSVWVPNVRITVDYDANDRLMYSLQKSWSNEAWENSTQAFYQYDSNGWLTEYRKQRWFNGNWSNNIKLSYDYNETGVEETGTTNLSGVISSPNPFVQTTTISFLMEEPGYAEVGIYDLTGNFVMTLDKGWKEQGSQNLVFDASALGQGTYICRIQSGKTTLSQKLLLIK